MSGWGVRCMKLQATLVGMARKVLTYQNLLRFGGFIGLMYLLVFRSKPDGTLIIALCAMMGLPTFWDLDRSKGEQRDSDPPDWYKRIHGPKPPPDDKES